MTATTIQTRRSPWPYAIAGYFAIAIAGIAIFITWAVKQNMDLVRSDYYEQEILFQQHMDAIARTKALGANAGVRFDAQSRALRVLVPAAHVTQEFRGQLHLYRPSDAKRDCQVELQPGSSGEQRVSTSGLLAGVWKARVEWRANGQAYLIEQNLFLVE